MKRLLLLVLLLTVGCAKKPATAPVPGSINSVDSWAFRTISDSGAAIHTIKTWEQCSVANFPATVTVDGNVEVCDPKAGVFPPQYKGELNTAITAFNAATQAGTAYHAAGTGDTTALTAAVTQLTTAVTQLMSTIGSKQ